MRFVRSPGGTFAGSSPDGRCSQHQLEQAGALRSRCAYLHRRRNQYEHRHRRGSVAGSQAGRAPASGDSPRPVCWEWMDRGRREDTLHPRGGGDDGGTACRYRDGLRRSWSTVELVRELELAGPVVRWLRAVRSLESQFVARVPAPSSASSVLADHHRGDCRRGRLEHGSPTIGGDENQPEPAGSCRGHGAGLRTVEGLGISRREPWQPESPIITSAGVLPGSPTTPAVSRPTLIASTGNDLRRRTTGHPR